MIPFNKPKIDQRAIEEVVDTLQSGWITTGPKTKKFEKKLEDFCGNPKTLCVGSATHGLELMLRWFGVKEGDEVIVPAYTYSATANVVLRCGAKLVLADTNEDDFNIAVDSVRNLISERTKVIIPVDIGGLPCNYTALNQLIRSPEIKNKFTPSGENQKKLGRILLLADAAHSLGAKYNNKMTGLLADATVFSFQAVKNLTTSEGGAIAFNLPQPFDNVELYEYLNIASLHGQTQDALAKSRNKSWKYDVIMPGYKFNMTDLVASIGVVEIENYEEDHLTRRKQIFEYYTNRLKIFDWAVTPEYKTTEYESSYHIYMLKIKGASEELRDKIMEGMFAGNVSVNVHFQPIPLLSYYNNNGFKIKDYPNSYKNYISEISLPVYYDLSDEDLNTIVDTLIETCKEIGL
ncbi:MAG: DegT/DnrJ/EryC1/StrS family aminotransferase [Bacteroidales bacterium]|nr:DegT/DnrJ/EryC1/StrS family aminotransferase [Bacteroidales bacterium]